jgi:hypothetical protein
MIEQPPMIAKNHSMLHLAECAPRSEVQLMRVNNVIFS